MKVLVTGSEGSLMQAVIPKLVEAGHTVTGVDNLRRYGERPGHAKVEYDFRKVDLSDPELVDLVFASVRPDYVIQAAALIYGVGGFNRYCADILSNDVALHRNVLEASVDMDVKKVVYISSSMVYEQCVQDIHFPVKENMPDFAIAPATDYGLSKFVGERLSKAFWKQYELPYTIWRPFNIITPYENAGNLDNGVSHVFADFIRNIVIDKQTAIPLIGDGEQIRCFTWIHEVAAAIADNLLNLNTDNDIFNLGNHEPITMKELALAIAEEAWELGLIKSPKISFITNTQNFENDVRVRVPDVSHAYKVLGWEANKRVRESIKECLLPLTKL